MVFPFPEPFPGPSGVSFSVLSLFSAGEVGAWYDPSDFSTMFQDSAGTTPVTAVEQPVGLILDKSKGLAVGPELITNGDFSSGTGWTLGAGWTISGGVLNGSTGAFSETYFSCTTVAGATYKVSLSITTSAGNILVYASNGGNVTLAGTGTRTCYVVAGATGLRLSIGGVNFVGTIDNVSMVLVAGNHASQATSASRPILRQEATGQYYLAFDGTDDSLATASIDFSATDKMTVWAGVRKLSDAAVGVLAELSVFSNANGSFFLYGHSTLPRYEARIAGSLNSLLNSPSSYTSPISNVLTLSGNISGDTEQLRINGSLAVSDVADLGTGNFGNHVLYIGARGGTSAWLNGRIYSLIVRGAATTPDQISRTETWVNSKTGAY